MNLPSEATFTGKPEVSRARRWPLSLGMLIAVALLVGAGLEVAQAGNVPQLAAIQQERAKRKVLLTLESRLREIEAREKELDRREARLDEATVDLKKRLDALAALRGELETLLANEEAIKQKKFKEMARIHTSMPTGRSAEILASMDNTTAVRILGNLTKDRVAKTLSKMSPDRALELSQAILGIRQTNG